MLLLIFGTGASAGTSTPHQGRGTSGSFTPPADDTRRDTGEFLP